MLFVVLLAASACMSGQRLPEGVDPAKRDWYGEFFNLDAYAKCRTQVLQNDMACEYLRLTRVEEPEFWPYPEVPKPKLPEPPNPPVYQPGMTSEEYFKALCEKEAGEFIYKTVENVEGIYQIRPRKRASWDALFDRYVMEDPYGYTNWEAEDPRTLFIDPPYRSFRFLELSDVRKGNRGWFINYTAKPPSPSGELDASAKLRSRYAFTWRGIDRPPDRDLSIAGGELIVIDLKTGEVLGIRRGFARSGFVRNSRSGIQWESAEVCPRLRTAPGGFDKWPSFTYSFVSKILRPAVHQ